VARPAKKPSPKKAAKSTPVKKTIPAAAPKAAVGSAKATTKTAAKTSVAKPATAAKHAAAKPVSAAAAVAVAPPPRKPRRPAFSPAEIEQIRADLEVQRQLFVRELAELEAGTFNQSQSDLSGEVSFDEESADAGTFTFERERDLSLSNNLKDLLDKVDSALRRIKFGSYGSCERCGRPIDKARLRALPYSVLCIDCKKLEERVR